MACKDFANIHFLNLCETDPDYPSAHNFVIEHKSIRHGRELYALGGIKINAKTDHAVFIEVFMGIGIAFAVK